jgi:MFS family permease
MMRGELLTEKGLRHFNYGFIISMVSYGIIGILFLALLIALPNIDNETGPFGNPFGFWAPVAWFIIGVVIAFFVLFIGLIFFLIGLLSLNNGRWEFGMRHSATFQKGMVLVIIGFIIALFGGAGFGLLSSFVGVVTTILISLGLMYMIQEISDQATRQLLLYATITYVSISVITAIVSLTLLLTLFGGPGFDVFWLIAIIPIGLGSLSIIPLAMFFIAYKRTYYRINKREIQPMPPPPMMPYPMPYPSPYQPYPPQYQQPYQYPQAAPPPQYPPPNIGIKAMPRDYSQSQGYQGQGSQGSIRCTSCGANIPSGVNVCPVCFAEQRY